MLGSAKRGMGTRLPARNAIAAFALAAGFCMGLTAQATELADVRTKARADSAREVAKQGNAANPADAMEELDEQSVREMGRSSDSDADSISNAEDNCPAISNIDQHDQDADGVGDSCDRCPYVPAKGYINGCPEREPC